MFASTSTPVRAISTLTAQSSRSFATTPTILARRKELVELLVDIPELNGQKGDRILVAPGHARHRLVPLQKARWIPNWQWYKITPFKAKTKLDKTQPEVNPDLLAVEAPTPAEIAARKARERALAESLEPTPQELLDRLHLLPNDIIFAQRTTEDNTTLHGSVTLAMISHRLIELDLAENEVSVEWQDEEGGDRMKSVGERKAVVAIRGKGREKVTLDVKVVPAAEGQADS